MWTVLAGASTPAEAKEWQGLGATSTVLLDGGSMVYNQFNVTDRPMFMVIDTDMNIVHRESNALGLMQADGVLEKLLSAP